MLMAVGSFCNGWFYNHLSRQERIKTKRDKKTSREKMKYPCVLIGQDVILCSWFLCFINVCVCESVRWCVRAWEDDSQLGPVLRKQGVP